MNRVRLAAVLTAAVVVAGCSSSNDAPSPESSTPAPSGHGAYAKCLQEHGVSAPPGPVAGPPPGSDEATWHKATEACASMAPGPDAG
ncbi:hypothetical protein [Mycolicibacterium stellerae]|uniref:hypothetical protein n=1 Tax=Mycolicibacterium stellerae TaxID=2358193 RepID=UPI000F0BB109|nr:hypothetical protein [Mycolicibacterium stellerae]